MPYAACKCSLDDHDRLSIGLCTPGSKRTPYLTLIRLLVFLRPLPGDAIRDITDGCRAAVGDLGRRHDIALQCACGWWDR
jgi:hypothetical protein